LDSVTQILLGAAVGHATLGGRVGRKALAWGAVLGLAPDLDVLIPQPDAISAFTEHRGFSHSLIVHTAIAPVIGAGLARLHRADGVGVWPWALLAWLALATHGLLDACTVYGTQLLWPATGPPVGLGSVFIIDPLYTLPLLVAVALAALGRTAPRTGVRACALALALSTGYLALGIGIQRHVHAIAAGAALDQGLAPTRLLVTPTPFNVIAWRALATIDGGYAEGYYSLLDADRTIGFERHVSDDAVLGAIADDPAVARLRWFTKGFWRVRLSDGTIVVTDLRMGFEPKYVFSFVVGRLDGAVARAVPSRRAPVERPGASDLGAVWERLLGDRVVAAD